MICSSNYGNYRQVKFTDVWETVEAFLEDYNDNGIPATITDDRASTLFYLLYARYGNDIVASSDINRFKYALFGIIFQYGPAWDKRLELQANIRALTLEELKEGTKRIFNRADNPANAPSTGSLTEVDYINGQTTDNTKRGKIEAYSMQYSMIDTDVSEEFLRRFKKLFLTIVQPELPLWYVDEDEEQ